MGDNCVVKMGRYLVKSIVGKSKRVVKKSIAKVFDIGALDRVLDRLLEKSTAMAVMDDRFSSVCRSILVQSSKHPSQKPQYESESEYDKEEMVMTKEELKGENGNEEALIPAHKGSLDSLDNLISSSTLAEEPVPPCTLEATVEEEKEEKEEEHDDDDDDDGDDDGVFYKRGDYSTISSEEFKEMVEGFIQRFNEHIAHEYNSVHQSHPQEIVFVGCHQQSGPVY